MKPEADRRRVLEHRDPPDPSYAAAMARLRARFRAAR